MWLKGEHSDEEREFSDEVSKKIRPPSHRPQTYEMVKRFWSTPDGVRSDSVMAEVMNRTPKIVFFEIMKPEKGSPV
ncbi:MAG: hypothetical protein WCF90_02145 [Methanomicrobiales archaeon]